MEKKLIQTLLEQNKELIRIVSAISNETSDKNNINTQKITSDLEEFAHKLEEHVTLENDKFYVILIRNMQKAGMDVSGIETFIAEMKGIADRIIDFLTKYKTSDSISEDLDKFNTDLNAMIKILEMRIESEEEGVYLYWKPYGE